MIDIVIDPKALGLSLCAIDNVGPITINGNPTNVYASDLREGDVLILDSAAITGGHFNRALRRSARMVRKAKRA